MKNIALGLALGLTLLGGAACDTNPSVPPLGSLTLTSTAPAVEQGFTTSDGWAVKYTKFSVSYASIVVAGSDEVVTASDSDLAFDYAQPPTPQVLLHADNRVARAWQDVNFEITSVDVEATMTKAAITKTLRAALQADTSYTACTGQLNDAQIPGLVIPTGGTDTANVLIAADVLFADNRITRGHVLRGDPIANADANNDGVVDLPELGAVTLETARTSNGLYEIEPGTDDTLGAFITEQTRSLVASFRDQGGCTVAPVAAAP